MRRLTALVIVSVLSVGCGAQMATDPNTSPPQGTTDPNATPNYAATPTSAPSSAGRLPLPPNTADVEGLVLDAILRAPVATATIRLIPFNVVLTSARDGTFAARGLPVTGRCRWLTIEVEASGYGKLVTVDHPLYQGRAKFDLDLRAEEQRRYFGPPRSMAYEGEAFCSR